MAETGTALIEVEPKVGTALVEVKPQIVGPSLIEIEPHIVAPTIEIEPFINMPTIELGPEFNMNMAAQATNIGDFSNSINYLNTDIRQTQVAVDELNQAFIESLEVNNDFSVNKEFNTMQVSIYNIGTELDTANEKQKALNKSMEEGTGKSTGFLTKVKKIAEQFKIADKAKKLLAGADAYTQNQIQLGQINDGLQTTEELNQKVFKTAQRTRTGYSNMLGVVDTLGTKAGDAFSSNDEMLYFSELLTKSFKSAGMSAEEQSTAIEGIAGAMGSGGMTGDAGAEILKNTPELADILTNSLGITTDQLNQMAVQGSLTSEVIKQAMYGASESINAKFAETPATFGEVARNIQDIINSALIPAFSHITNWLNSETGMKAIQVITTIIGVLGKGVEVLFTSLTSLGGFLQENWSILAPILLGIIGALIIYNAIMGIGWFLTLQNYYAKVKSVGISFAQQAAIIATTFAQFGLNAALSACPLTWIIIMIIALIAIFYAVIAAVNKFAGTSISATGVIAGAFMTALAFIGNIFVGLYNYVINIMATFVNYFLGIAEFFANVFNDPIGSIIRLFANMADTILSFLEGIASAMDAIFGTNMADSLSGWRKDLKAMVKDVAGEAKNKIQRVDVNAIEMERFDYGDAYNMGYDWGENMEDSLSFDNLFGGLGLDELEEMDTWNMEPTFDGENNVDYVETVGNVNDTVDVSSEDLKIMRDLAERKAIENFVTLTPTVSVTTGDIRNGMEADDIVSRIITSLDTEIATNAKGAYAT